MTQNLERSLNSCQTLKQAFKAAMSLPLRTGTIRLTSARVNGSITFADGKIIGASIDETGLKGEAAFNQLADVKGARFVYLPDSQCAPGAADTATATQQAAAPESASPQAILRNIAADEERREFLATTGAMAIEEGLQGQQRKILAVAGKFVDDEAFQDVAFPDLHSTQALSEKQEQALRALMQTADAQEFAARTGALDNSDLALDEEQLWMLAEVLLARTADAQKQEFLHNDSRLLTVGNEHLRDFQEPAQPPPAAQLAAPKGLATPAFASDFARTDAIRADQEAAGQPDHGLFRSAAGAAAFSRGAGTKNCYMNLLAPGLVAVFCVALFTVPAMIRNSAAGTFESELDEQATQAMVDDEVAANLPAEASQPFLLPAHLEQPAPPPAAGDSQAKQSEPVATAVTAQAQVAGDQSIDSLEKELFDNPMSIETRLQLIRFYKARKNFKKARELAVLGFKLPQASAQQRQMLFQLFKECK